MSLWIHDSGANETEIRAGVEAAKAVLERYNVSAEDAFEAKKKINDGEAVTNQETMRAIAWDEADNAAVMACCKGWVRIPDEAHLQLG